jgi:flagellar biosynthetic protein FliO
MDSLYIQLIQAIFVFGGILALVFLVSRYVGTQWTKTSGGSGLDVMGALQIGPKARIVILRFAEKVYVLGVAEQNISLLEVREEDKLPEGIEFSSGTGADVGGLLTQLDTYMRRLKGEEVEQ